MCVKPMITLCTDEDQFLPQEPRHLSISDLTCIPNVTRKSAEIWLGMSCKLMLQNPDVDFTDEVVSDLVMETWPNFWMDRMDDFTKIFRQVESLKTVWYPKKEQIVEVQKNQTKEDLIAQVISIKHQLGLVLEALERL